MTAIGDIFWARLPATVGRVFPSLQAVLTDGREMRSVPVLGDVAPVLALVFGIVVSVTRDPVAHEIYSSSAVLLVAFVAISTLGGALGGWAWLGYVIADLLLVPKTFYGQGLDHLYLERVPQLITFLLLFGMMALIPPTVTVIRSQLGGLTARAGAGRPIADAVTHGVLSAVFVAAWAISIPALVPPYWTWFGRVAPVLPVQTPRDALLLLALVALLVSAGRIFVVTIAERTDTPAGPDLGVERPAGVGRIVSVVARTAALSLVLMALAHSVIEAVIIIGGMLAATVLRSEILPLFPGYVRTVARVPLIARVVLSALVGGVVGWLLLQTDQGHQLYGALLGDSFIFVIVSIVLSAIVAALLMPSEAEPAARRPAVATS